MQYFLMKFRREYYQRFLDFLERLRARGERIPLVLKIDDIITGYDRKSLFTRSFILSFLIHFMILFWQGWEVKDSSEPETQMIQIQFGTETAAPAVAPIHEAIDQHEQEVKEAKTTPAPQPKKASRHETKTPSVKVDGSKYGQQETGEIAPEDYLQLLQYTVQQMGGFPPEAGNVKGTAILHLEFDRNGYVHSFTLAQSTGNKILDQAALNVARRLSADPFPPAPRDFDRGERILKYNFVVKYKPQG